MTATLSNESDSNFALGVCHPPANALGVHLITDHSNQEVLFVLFLPLRRTPAGPCWKIEIQICPKRDHGDQQLDSFSNTLEHVRMFKIGYFINIIASKCVFFILVWCFRMYFSHVSNPQKKKGCWDDTWMNGRTCFDFVPKVEETEGSKR